MNARVKPSRAILATTHEADAETYQRLAQACLRACMLREKDIYVSLPYFVKIDESFPRGVLVQKEGLKDVYKIKVVKLTNWLHERGFLPDNHRGVMLSLRDLAYKEAHINSLLKNVKIELDSDKNLWENVEVENKEGE